MALVRKHETSRYGEAQGQGAIVAIYRIKRPEQRTVWPGRRDILYGRAKVRDASSEESEAHYRFHIEVGGGGAQIRGSTRSRRIFIKEEYATPGKGSLRLKYKVSPRRLVSNGGWRLQGPRLKGKKSTRTHESSERSGSFSLPRVIWRKKGLHRQRRRLCLRARG